MAEPRKQKSKYVITLSEEAHKIVRILAANEDTSLYDAASRLIVIGDQTYPKK